MKKIKFCLIIFLLINILYPYFDYCYYYGDAEYVWSESVVATSSTDDDTDFLELTCESAILIEQTTGKILYEKDAHTQLRPASVTKIMTILLIMEAIENGELSYETEVTCSENAASMGGSQIWLEVRRNPNS